MQLLDALAASCLCALLCSLMPDMLVAPRHALWFLLILKQAQRTKEVQVQ